MRAIHWGGAHRLTQCEPGGREDIMKRTTIVRALLTGSALFISTGALAQEAEPQPDASDATADAAIAQAQDLDDAQAKIELLQAQVEALQESIAKIQETQAKATPSWKGAPELADKDAGFTFKPKGYMLSGGLVAAPASVRARAQLAARNLTPVKFAELK